MKFLLENWREYINENKAKPKLRVFDFDDTIAKSDSKIHITMRVFDFDDTIAKSDSKIHITTDTGEKITMDPGKYATHKMNPNYEYDFSEFDEVINPREIVQITNVIRNVLNAEEREPEGREITARDPAAEEPIKNYLESIGLDTSKITFELLATSVPQAKADWIAKRIDNGAVDVLFFDDSGKNVDAVQALSDQYPDVKIKARKVRYAKDLADNSGGED
jgi:hypothetical protein